MCYDIAKNAQICIMILCPSHLPKCVKFCEISKSAVTVAVGEWRLDVLYFI